MRTKRRHNPNNNYGPRAARSHAHSLALARSSAHVLPLPTPQTGARMRSARIRSALHHSATAALNCSLAWTNILSASVNIPDAHGPKQSILIHTHTHTMDNKTNRAMCLSSRAFAREKGCTRPKLARSTGGATGARAHHFGLLLLLLLRSHVWQWFRRRRRRRRHGATPHRG